MLILGIEVFFKKSKINQIQSMKKLSKFFNLFCLNKYILNNEISINHKIDVFCL